MWNTEMLCKNTKLWPLHLLCTRPFVKALGEAKATSHYLAPSSTSDCRVRVHCFVQKTKYQ